MSIGIENVVSTHPPIYPFAHLQPPVSGQVCLCAFKESLTRGKLISELGPIPV